MIYLFLKNVGASEKFTESDSHKPGPPLKVIVALLMATIMAVMVACSDPEDGTINPIHTVVGPVADDETRSAPTPTTTRIPGQDADVVVGSTKELSTTVESSPELLATVISNDNERCGLLLPIMPDREAIEITSFSDLSLADNWPPSFSMPEDALPALKRILDAPDSVGLAAYQIGRESDGVYLNADNPMPLASVVKLINLIAYAEAVDDGRLDPAEWIPLSELEKTYLPGLDLGAHSRAIDELDDRSLIAGDPPATPLEEVPWIMIRHSSNAASDYIHLLLGQETLERTAFNLGMESQTAPCPWIGQFLIMSNHTRSGSDSQAVEEYIAQPDKYGLDVMTLTNMYADDPAFRLAEQDQARGSRPVQAQRLFSENLNAQASAGDYADLMAKIIQNALKSSYINILVRRVLEWPMAFPENQALFSYLGYKNGVLPGILTTVYYGQRLVDGGQVVVALFYRDLPMSTYRLWRQELPHDELARWIVSDPEAIPALRELLCCRPSD